MSERPMWRAATLPVRGGERERESSAPDRPVSHKRLTGPMANGGQLMATATATPGAKPAAPRPTAPATAGGATAGATAAGSTVTAGATAIVTAGHPAGGAQNSPAGTAPANTAPQPSPSGYFDFTVFGAVKVQQVTTRAPVALTDEQRHMLAGAEGYFSNKTNKHVLEVDFPTKSAAMAFRGAVEAFAAELTAKLAAATPQPDHITASFPRAGKGNTYPRTWNAKDPGTNVTFRLARGKWVHPDILAQRAAKRAATAAARKAAKAAGAPAAS